MTFNTAGIVCVLVACIALPLALALPASLGDEADWTLIWADEFEGSSLNTSNWTPKTGTHTNQELEYYLPKQVSVEGGNLVLTTIPQEYAGLPYVSGWVDTQNKFSAVQGRWEIHAQLPFGTGMWPAQYVASTQAAAVCSPVASSWLMPNYDICWPMGGEIDIMENLGNNMQRVHGALHWSHTVCGDPGEKSGGAWSQDFGMNLNDTFHSYGLVWNDTMMAYYMDDIVYTTIENPVADFAQKPFFVILNSAVGGWAGKPTKETTWPQRHLIDYVRVYKAA